MTLQEETEFHELAKKLVELSANPPWEAMRYAAIGKKMTQLAEYCAPETELDSTIDTFVKAKGRDT